MHEYTATRGVTTVIDLLMEISSLIYAAKLNMKYAYCKININHSLHLFPLSPSSVCIIEIFV